MDDPFRRADALQDITDPFHRAKALREIAAAQARAGQAEEARLTFALAFQAVMAIFIPPLYIRPSSPAEKVSRAWGDIVEAQVRAGQEPEEALRMAETIRDPSWRARVLGGIARACVDGNDIKTAQTSLTTALRATLTCVREDDRAESFHRLACIQAKAHLWKQAIATSNLILVKREEHLPGIVEGLLGANDRMAFKELLLPCAAHLRSAWAVCVLLPRAYPEQAPAIAQVALRFGRSSASVLASRVERTETVSGLINLFVLLMWMLSVIFSPHRITPGAAQAIRTQLPMTWIGEGAMIFRLSQTLNAKIKAGTLATVPLDGNPFADWSAALFVAGRTQ